MRTIQLVMLHERHPLADSCQGRCRAGAQPRTGQHAQAQFRGLPEALNDCSYLVPRMSRLQQQDAIERPLQEQGVQMHAPLVQRLLNDSAEDPDHLPVLQHLLRRAGENWNQRGVGGPIGLADYQAVGGWKRLHPSQRCVPFGLSW